MNELIVQPFFWGDTVAVICALWIFFAYAAIFCLNVGDGQENSFIDFLYLIAGLYVSAYVIFIYASLYGEVIAQWLSTIF